MRLCDIRGIDVQKGFGSRNAFFHINTIIRLYIDDATHARAFCRWFHYYVAIAVYQIRSVVNSK